MTDFNFRKSIDKQYDDREKATAAVAEVDAYVFCTSSKYLGERLFAWQSLAIKIIYGLWKAYPVTPEEQKVLDLLRNGWSINLDLENRDVNEVIEILILVLGRRSGKSSLISFMQTYEAYKLICKGDPQKYYNIRNRNPIYIINCAKDGDQAQDPFRLCKDNIKRIPFFSKYIDSTKDNEGELRLFTPADLYENEQIRHYNDTRPKHLPKKNYLEGSIMICAFTTSAASKRGKSIIFLVFDEFAHFDRAKTTGGGMTEEDILREMPQTDYAMFKALEPATRDFNLEDKGIHDGKIIMISSPKEKGGVFYHHYCLAGGSEQANALREDRDIKYLTLQLATWECNPKWTRASLDGAFRKDPVGAAMEYGAHFGEQNASFVDAQRVDDMVDTALPMAYTGKWGHQYIISVDPAAKGDTYVVSWGHAETSGDGHMFIVDGTQGFRPLSVMNHVTNKLIKVPVDAGKVTEYIAHLAKHLSMNGRLLEIIFDQWISSSSITTLKAKGFVALETFFTNQYKGEIYTNFLEKLNMGAVKVFGAPPTNTPAGFVQYQPGWLEQLKLELKYLTKCTSGNTTYYSAPDSGPITTDDFPDTLANLVYRLNLYLSGDRKILQDLYKQTGIPVKRSPNVRGSLGAGGFPSVTRSPSRIGKGTHFREDRRGSD